MVHNSVFRDGRYDVSANHRNIGLELPYGLGISEESMEKIVLT